MYNITVMDQYSLTIVTVPANMLSVELHQDPPNNTISRIDSNREYTITTSAISDRGVNYPSDSVVVSKYSWRYTHICIYVQAKVYKANNYKLLVSRPSQRKIRWGWAGIIYYFVKNCYHSKGKCYIYPWACKCIKLTHISVFAGLLTLFTFYNYIFITN